MSFARLADLVRSRLDTFAQPMTINSASSIETYEGAILGTETRMEAAGEVAIALGLRARLDARCDAGLVDAVAGLQEGARRLLQDERDRLTATLTSLEADLEAQKDSLQESSMVDEHQGDVAPTV